VNVSLPFILRPVATSLAMAGILLIGLTAYLQLPVSALPQVDYPTIDVTTQMPGAGPEVMASSVTAPLERQFGSIAGLTTMRSASAFGTSSITLQFSLDRSIDSAAQDVQAAIAAAAGLLPRTLPNPPVYHKVNPADIPILSLSATSATLPLPQVADYAETILAQKFAQIDGVGLVLVQGGQKPAVRIRVNPMALTAIGLSLEDVRQRVAQASVDQPKGSLEGARQAYTIVADDQLFTAATYGAVIIGYKNGAPVRVGDVGSVVDGVENDKLTATAGVRPAVIIDILRQPGANVITTVERIRAALPQLRAVMPPAIRVDVLSDRTTSIRASVADVEWTLLLTVGLVVLVLFLFLRRVWATVIPSVTLPLSLIGTFAGMYFANFSLDNLSLMALTIATGFVVDDAIVMIENISRYIEAGDTPFEAAIRGSRQIGFTIISLTASLIAVFIPLLFMGGIIGRLFREFATTLSVAVTVSAIVSLTLTPMMCAYLLKPQPAETPDASGHRRERGFPLVTTHYGRSLRWVLRHRHATLAVTGLTLFAAVVLYAIVPKGFLPQQDTGIIAAVNETAADTAAVSVVERQRRLTDLLLKDPAVASVYGFTGAGTVNETGNIGRIYIVLKPHGARDDITTVMNRLSGAAGLLEGGALFMQAAQDIQLDNRISRTQYQYTLQAADTAELDVWAARLVAALRLRPELRDVASDQSQGGLQAPVRIDRDAASRLGVSLQAIDDTLYDAFGQRQITTVYTQLNQYHVILEVDPHFKRDPEALNAIYVNSAGGPPVPLASLASFDLQTGNLVLHHLAQFPAVAISFNLGGSLGAAEQAIRATQAAIGMPDTIVASFSGSAAEFQTSLASQPVLILASIIVVYIVLGVLYESYIHPITILSTLPSAGVGALLALMLCGYELNLVSLIGIVLLIGIVKKNAIMMVDFALDAARTQGMSPHDSIYNAAILRFRPIMMTTIAALLGAMPLALGSGPGSELRRPMGIAITGGLLLSQFLTLYTTPVIYLALARVSDWITSPRRLTASTQHPPP
jgi:hydrophobe/amphiphile efflux-1 (HAE1) family protein